MFMWSVVIFQIGTIIRLQLQSQMLGNLCRIVGAGIVCFSLVKQVSLRRLTQLPMLPLFLLLWNIINIIFSIFSGGGLNFTRSFSEDSYLFNFFLPFLLLYDVSTLDVRKLLNMSVLFVVFAAILIALNYNYLALASSSYAVQAAMAETEGLASFAQLPIMWSIPAVIVLMNPRFVNKKILLFTVLAYVFAIAFSMTFGRRSTSLYGVIFLLFSYLIFLKNKSYRLSYKVGISFLCVVVCLVIIPYVLNSFDFLFERGLEDSRTGVNEAFFADMNTRDYILGRGLNGTYYDPLNVFDNIGNKRTGQETGYLNIILHAGLLFLIPYLLIGLISVYWGLFRSRNTWVKSLALYILLNDLMLILGSYPGFNLRFFILWIGILFCNSKQFRSMNNKEIAAYFKLD